MNDLLLFRALVQILLVSGIPWDVEALKRKLVDLWRESGNVDERVLSRSTSAEIIAAIRKHNEGFQKFGLQVMVRQKTLSLYTTPTNGRLAAFLSEYGESREESISDISLEIVVCIAYKEPVTLAEINRVYASDKRHIVQKLEARGWIKSETAAGGFVAYRITNEALASFGKSSREELISFFESELAKKKSAL